MDRFIAATAKCLGAVSNSVQTGASSIAQKISKLATSIFSSIKAGFASSFFKNAFFADRKIQQETQLSSIAEGEEVEKINSALNQSQVMTALGGASVPTSLKHEGRTYSLYERP